MNILWQVTSNFGSGNSGVSVSDLSGSNVNSQAQFESGFPQRNCITYRQRIDYFRLSNEFTGDKVASNATSIRSSMIMYYIFFLKITAYGGKFSFKIQYAGSGSPNNDALVVIKGGQRTLSHRSNVQFSSDRLTDVSIDMYEVYTTHLFIALICLLSVLWEYIVQYTCL